MTPSFVHTQESRTQTLHNPPPPPNLITTTMSSSTASGDPATYQVENCRDVLRVFSDGSIVRTPSPSFPVPVHDDGTVVWTDAQFNTPHNLHLRLYKPHVSPAGETLPIFYYYHGGGFCIGSRTWPNCQNYCLRLASDLRAVVVAPDYRLAPEHRLPAAVEDGAAALTWIRSAAASHPFLAGVADVSRVFVSGDSAGGNIVHHLTVRFGSVSGREELNPVRVRGYVQLMPFFGGIERTESEADCPVEAFLNRDLFDRFWRLSVPVGSTVDDPVVNPFGPGAPELEGVEFEPMVVVVGGRDLLRDRAAEYGRRLKGWGKPVEVVEFEGQQHGFFTIDPWSEPAGELMRLIKRFVEENSGST